MGAKQGPETGWPLAIHDLKPSDFCYGSWMKDQDGNVGDRDGPDNVSCGTRCCLVGWARVSFGLHAAPNFDLTHEAAEFLTQFMEFAGYTSAEPEFMRCGGYGTLQKHASDCFEGEYPHQRLTPSKAAAAWKKTREHFGYTEVS